MYTFIFIIVIHKIYDLNENETFTISCKQFKFSISEFSKSYFKPQLVHLKYINIKIVLFNILYAGTLFYRSRTRTNKVTITYCNCITEWLIAPEVLYILYLYFISIMYTEGTPHTHTILRHHTASACTCVTARKLNLPTINF